RNPGITQAGIIVARVHDGDARRQIVEQALRQLGNRRERDRQDHDVGSFHGSANIYRKRADLIGEGLHTLWTFGVSDADLMPRSAEFTGQRSADVARADDADLHDSLLGNSLDKVRLSARCCGAAVNGEDRASHNNCLLRKPLECTHYISLSGWAVYLEPPGSLIPHW